MDNEKEIGTNETQVKFASLDSTTRTMENEKGINIDVTELTSPSSLDSKPVKASHEESLKAPWPSQPQPLKEARLSKRVNNIYDVVLCVAPLILLTKVGLVFAAAHIEKRNQLKGSVASVANPASKLTTYLIDFNSQVRSFPF
jgi:hypothetical protein